tara:strand:+ start:635 stop:862 length:228 start_codon:yes stop_codon:yes gene_type:complete
MTKTRTNRPTRIDKFLIWLIQRVPRFNYIVEQGIGEAYDLGYGKGLAEGAKIDPNNKRAKRQFKKALKEAYKEMN